MKAMCHNFMCTACWEYTHFSSFLLLLLGMATVEHLPPCQPCLSNFISKLLNLGWPSNENINTFSSASCLSVSATVLLPSHNPCLSILLLSFCYKSFLTLASTHPHSPPTSILLHCSSALHI